MAAATAAAVGLNYNESNSRGVCRIAIVIIISSLTTLMYTHVHTCTRMHAYTRKLYVFIHVYYMYMHVLYMCANYLIRIMRLLMIITCVCVCVCVCTLTCVEALRMHAPLPSLVAHDNPNLPSICSFILSRITNNKRQGNSRLSLHTSVSYTTVQVLFF